MSEEARTPTHLRLVRPNPDAALAGEDRLHLQQTPRLRRFLAAALADAEQSTIVNASDPDWFEIEDVCRRNGVVVEQLIETWLRGQAEA